MNSVYSRYIFHHLPEAEPAPSSKTLMKGGMLSVLLCSALLCPPQAQAAESEADGTGSLVVTGTTAVAKDGTSYELADNASVYGNRGDGDITGAALSIEGNNVLDLAAGGFSNDGSATGGNTSNNAVTVKNSNVSTISGGMKDELATVAWNSCSNTVTVTNCTFGTVYGGFVPQGGQSDSNTVSVYSSAGSRVLGGTAFESGTSSGNTVYVQDSTAWFVAGGVANGTGTASGNSVIFSGGSIDKDGYSGSVSDDTIDTDDYGGSVSDDTIDTDDYGGSVSDDTIDTEGYGESLSGGAFIAGAISWKGKAVNNKVTLLGSPELSNATLYGGYSENESEAVELRAGNRLHVQTASPITVRDICNFEEINVSVPSLSNEYKSNAFLTLTNEAGTDLSKSVVTVTVSSGSTGGLSLVSGDRLILVKNSNGLTLGTYSVNEIEVTDASQLSAYGRLKPEKTNTSLDLVFSGGTPAATEQAAVLSEAHAAGGAIVLAGADMAAGPGMSAAMHAFDKKEVPYGLAVFGAVSGASQRYNLESHIDLRSVSLIAGPVFAASTGCGRLTAGAFFEYGAGSYGAEHDIRSSPEINADGSLSYMGAGLLARIDLPSTGSGNFYIEASGRAGTLRNGFESQDSRLKNMQTGRTLEYDMDMAYQSLHGSVGYLWDVADNMTLDLSGSYFWTHVFSDAVISSTGGRIEYDDFTSNRVRIGAKLSYEGSEIWKPYVGAAFEHEFDGEARVRANGCDTDTSELRGSTAIGELGLSLTSASAGIPLTIDLNMQGFAGKRQGIAGNLMVLYEF